MDLVFKALADPTRRKLLDRLYTRHGLTLGELSARMGMTRQAVTQHLALLEAANLVSAVWQGREKHHYLNPVPIHRIYDRWVKKFERRGLDALAELKRSVEGEEPHVQRQVRLRDVPRRDPAARVGRPRST